MVKKVKEKIKFKKFKELRIKELYEWDLAVRLHDFNQLNQYYIENSNKIFGYLGNLKSQKFLKTDIEKRKALAANLYNGNLSFEKKYFNNALSIFEYPR